MSGRAVSTAALTIDCRSVCCLRSCKRAVRDARDIEQIVEQQRHVLHLALDHIVGPALLRVGGVLVARDGGGLADRRQRIAQLMRERREEFVLAAVGLDELRAPAACAA